MEFENGHTNVDNFRIINDTNPVDEMIWLSIGEENRRSDSFSQTKHTQLTHASHFSSVTIWTEIRQKSVSHTIVITNNTKSGKI